LFRECNIGVKKLSGGFQSYKVTGLLAHKIKKMELKRKKISGIRQKSYQRNKSPFKLKKVGLFLFSQTIHDKAEQKENENEEQ